MATAMRRANRKDLAKLKAIIEGAWSKGSADNAEVPRGGLRVRGEGRADRGHGARLRQAGTSAMQGAPGGGGSTAPHPSKK